MTPWYILRVVEEEGAARQPSADYSGKQESAAERETVSLQPSLFVQADKGIREPQSRLARYVSAERSRPATMIGTEG